MRDINSWGTILLTLSRVFTAGTPPYSHDEDEEKNSFVLWQGDGKSKNFEIYPDYPT